MNIPFDTTTGYFGDDLSFQLINELNNQQTTGTGMAALFWAFTVVDLVLYVRRLRHAVNAKGSAAYQRRVLSMLLLFSLEICRLQTRHMNDALTQDLTVKDTTFIILQTLLYVPNCL